ncbi:MAG: hypothetical protein ABEH66_04570 [Halobacteriales archaeon]
MAPPSRGGPGSPYDRTKLYRRIHDRLATVAVFSNVRYEPSRTRPRRVIADVDPGAFLDEASPASDARLEIEFLFRPDADHYWIQWIEPDRDFSCGWHQDETHPDLGPCHFQGERPDGSTTRQSAAVLDAHPLQVIERRLEDLPGKLRSIDDGR